MKKSTLFFKVMVLLALLVPWTSWGQDANTLMGPSKPNWDNDKNLKGTLTLTIDGSGNIVDGEYKSSNYGGIRAEESVSKGVLSFDLQDWKFAESRNSPVISSSYGWNAQSYFSIKLDGENEGGHETVKISKGQNALSDFNKYFKIKVTKNHNEGNIKVVFKKGQTSLSDATVIINSDAQSGTKTYDGKPITVEVKVGNKTLTLGEDYVVVIGNKTITIASELPKDVKIENGKVVNYEITIKAKECGNYSGEKANVTAKITPKELTVTIKDQTKTLPGGKIETDASQWAEIKDKETAIISGDKVSLTGKIKEGEEGKLVADGDITTSNTNYTVKTVEPGTLTVKYELTDENWKQILNVTGEGKYPYDGEEHAATVTGKDGIDLSNCIEIVYRKKIEQGGTSIIKGKPVNAGEYEIVIRANEECDNVTITGENKQITVGEITINKREITVTGSLTIKEGEPLKDSYKFADIAGLNADGIIEGEEETVKTAITITPRSKENPTASEDAFTITLAETVGNYEISEDSKIALVVEEDSDKWQDGDAKAEVTVYVNENGKITKYGETEAENNQASISIGSFTDLSGWTFDCKLIDGKPTSQPELDSTGDNTFSWNVVGSFDILIISGTDATIEERETVKVKVKKGNEEGYLLVTFAKDESTEEPDPEDEWFEGDAEATVTVSVNTVGLITKVNGTEVSDNVASIAMSDLKVDKGWIFSYKIENIDGEDVVTSEAVITPETPEDKNTFAWNSVGSNSTLKISGTDATIENNETVRVKIENSTSNIEGYVLVTFVKENTTITAEDITEGGETSGEEGEIDNVLFTADGAKSIYYDGNSHGFDVLKATIDGIEVTLTEGTDYTVTYKENSTDEPVDAGSYTATITFKEDAGYSGTIELPIEISPRPITLYFSFGDGDNAIAEGEDIVLGKNAFIEVVAEESEKNMGFADGEHEEFEELVSKGVISAEFAMGEENSDGTWSVELVSFTYPAGEVEDYNLKYSNYDATLLTGHVKAQGEGGEATELPETDEDNDGNIDYPGEGGSGDIIVGDIDIIDEETGIGGSGINYRQYELNFCEIDFLTRLNDYDAEGLKLFSRHDKKYTKAGGSFTVWYEKDGVKNAEYGDYRIYISRNGANGNYTELKLDEVSDYFQIRNVQSDIYVRIYYGTGFPVANEEITATDVRAYAQANKIVVITPEPTDVQIISMAGAVVATDQVTGQREFANLAEGVYVVRMGETVIKLQVRN